MQLLKTIAILCHIGGGANYSLANIDEYQLKCQQLYLNCVLSDSAIEGKVEALDSSKVLARCIMHRKFI